MAPDRLLTAVRAVLSDAALDYPKDTPHRDTIRVPVRLALLEALRAALEAERPADRRPSLYSEDGEETGIMSRRERKAEDERGGATA